ncbi:MarR family winged helix-turn-helix transcriptional regulator [Actinoalloteichus spitiensis]|uniref:MarR family winged helix-turn-helix transcriptional regulator n=1 Tax=Actinoalloteichus spitiensis TaxID=252394 RepID=UPI0003068957|nr:MarR family transcriptional regulator [Actinoalloteichus spitiensis]
MSDTVLGRLPNGDEIAAWRSFLRAHARVTRCLEADLIAKQRLSLAAYDVLVHLAEAPEQRLRMTELADAVLLSRSGVTRLVDRLERVGLVRRVRVDTDGRGVMAVLTKQGKDRLRMAVSTHLAGVSQYFTSVLPGEELGSLADTCAKLADGQVPRAASQRAQA